jgi:hypothetical protein
MDRKKLSKLRRELKQLRAGKYNATSKKLKRFARKIGREHDPSRGKEPTYVSVPFPECNPLSIPAHKTVNPFTADNIMDDFEADLDRWEDSLEKLEAKTNDKFKQLPAKTIRKNSDSSGT